jgi:predicted aspartyl protease
MKRTRTGHYLVHPRINGKDVGWFIFDSGAGSMVISKTVAKELELPTFGQIPVGGIGGYTQSSLCQGKLFELGPISIHRTTYLEYDFGQLSAIFGEKIAGICGFDLFTRAIVALDSTASQIEIHNPAKFELRQAQWREMLIIDRHPHVRCRFEGDREGVFKIDTGANSTVIFTTQAVESFKLLENRKTESAKSGGVGGTVETRRGQIKWIEFGGQRFANQTAMFSQAREGALSNPYLTGVVGAPLLEPFKVFFHYGGKQIAFVPKTK